MGTCKQCGEPYTYRASVNSYLYFMCKTRRHFGQAYCDSPILPAQLFEAMTLDVVDNDILLRHNLELAMDQLRENSGTLHSDKAKRAEKIRESVADYDRRIEKAYLAWETRISNMNSSPSAPNNCAASRQKRWRNCKSSKRT